MATNLPNRAQITYNSGPTILSNQTNTTLIDQYTMVLTKTALTDTISCRNNISYIVRIDNTGQGVLYNPTVTDNLGGIIETITPLSYVEGSANYYVNGDSVVGTTTVGESDVTFSIATPLQSGDNLIIVYTVSNDAGIIGDITNTATATANSSSATGPIITETATATVTVESCPNVSIFKSADKDVVTSGDTLTYTFTLINTGLVPAEGISFVDALPPEFTVTNVSYRVNGVTTPIAATDYTITAPNTITIPDQRSTLTLTVPAATTDGPGILTITITGTVAQ